MLASLNRPLLASAKCYFGGGTRIVMELDEFRESVAIDFLCSDRAGYRLLRNAVTTRSLGEILALLGQYGGGSGSIRNTGRNDSSIRKRRRSFYCRRSCTGSSTAAGASSGSTDCGAGAPTC